MEDAQILDLYFRRDQEAIAQTAAAYGNKLYSLSHRILMNREDAEESVSDTYLKTWESIPPTRPTYFYAYLAKICRFVSLGRLDWRNADKRRAEIVELTAEMQLCVPDRRQEQQLESRELGRVLSDFLATLPEDSRMVFLRRYWYCESIEEVARNCGMTQSNVKTRLFRTRNALRGFLNKEGIRV